ncbi:MAG: HAMP domain-containing histidine kinase [Flavobacteriales bacterium]|nr:HAMP domain-containing histidine kinase [Flavobacteriales bacterium]
MVVIIFFSIFILGVDLIAQSEPIIKGNSEVEKLDYLFSRYLFDDREGIRSEVYKRVASTKGFEISSKYLAFQCFDAIKGNELPTADSILQIFEASKRSDDYDRLLSLYLNTKIALTRGDDEVKYTELEKAAYPPISFEDSTLYYYYSLLLAKVCEKNYDAPNFLKWCKSALEIKRLALSEDLNYTDFRRVGIAFDRSDIIDSTYWYYNAAVKIAMKQNDSSGLFMSNLDLGIFYSERGDISIALAYFAECARYLNSVTLRSQAAYHINCNIDYRKVNRLEIAREHLVQAEKIALEINDSSMLGHVYQNWVAQFGLEDKLDSIPSVLDKSERLLLNSGNFYGLGHLYIDKGHYFDNIKELDSALFWYEKARSYFAKINVSRGVYNSFVEEFLTLMNFKKYKAAKPLGLKLLDEAQIYNDGSDSMDVQFALAQIFEEQGDFKNALLYFRNANEIKNKLEGIESTRKVNMLRIKAEQAKQFELELEAEHNKRKLLETNNELESQRKTSFYMLLLVLGISVLLFVILWFSFKLKKTNKHLELLDKQKDDLMHVVAHDLLSPIGKVGALAHLMRMAEKEEEKEEYLDYLDTVVEDSSAMVQNLIDIHAFENDKVGLVKQKVSLSEILEDSLIGIKLRARKKQIEIIENIDQKAEVQTDVRLVKRIVENLVGNAVKFSPVGGRIEVNAMTNSDGLKIEIKDNGPGFSAEDKAKIFGKFTRLSARPTGEESSTGLGLAIVKELISHLSGEVLLESEAGKGATFIVKIPLG